MDLKSYSRWFDYSRARDDMLLATDTPWAPWFLAHSDDKKRTRLNIIKDVLNRIPYEDLPRKESNCRTASVPRDTKSEISLQMGAEGVLSGHSTRAARSLHRTAQF